jgi:hypothetical protein
MAGSLLAVALTLTSRSGQVKHDDRPVGHARRRSARAWQTLVSGWSPKRMKKMKKMKNKICFWKNTRLD